jgi:predicted MPP superfamily phosphohydrolase
MKSFLVLIAVLAALSVGTALYAGARSARALFEGKAARRVWLIFVVMISLTVFAGFALRENFSLPARALRFVGYGWLITIPYWLIATAFFDILGTINRRRHCFPRLTTGGKRIAVFLVTATVANLLALGHYNYANPVRTEMTVQIAKTVPPALPAVIRAAIASDFHMGDLIRRERVERFVNEINAVGADIILLPGDLVDGPLAPVLEQNCAAELRRLRAPLGVFAVLGNHDHDADAIAVYLQAAGIRVLRDEAVFISTGTAGSTAGNGFYLVGRKDRGHAGVAANNRKPLEQILAEARVNRAKPLIVLDHQPTRAALVEAARADADLLVSGHTHAGQTWPITWLIHALFDVTHGLETVPVTDGPATRSIRVLVTAGIGLWGFPARIGSRAEVVDLRLEF